MASQPTTLMRQHPLDEVVTHSAIIETSFIFDRHVRKRRHERFRKEPAAIARHPALSMDPNSVEPATR
jgi:hypothetical protein